MSNIKPLDIALIGCGKMGSAMLKGWLDSKIIGRAFIIDPAGLPETFAEYAPNPVTAYKSVTAFADADIHADIFVMATKPQIMAEVCKQLAPVLPRTALIMSIAAGQTITNFEKAFGETQPIIRAMPNTPSAIGQGISVAVANPHASDDHKQQTTKLLEAIGMVEWMDDEDLLNAVTALSGSGPAYVFLLIETMAKAGVHCGLSEELATRLARQTVIGSANLAKAEPQTEAATLRQNVTSPGGTTEAALKVLMADDGIQKLFDKALTAARDRGIELSSK